MKIGDTAVSEIMGTIFLLAMAVSVFSVVYFNVMSDAGPSPNTFATITGRYENNGNIAFDHSLGENISLDSSVILTIAGNQEPTRGYRRIRMTYRYYTSTVPEHIKLAALYYAAAILYETDTFQPIVPEGGGTTGVDAMSQAREWRRRADEICDKEYRPAHGNVQDTEIHRGTYRRGWPESKMQ